MHDGDEGRRGQDPPGPAGPEAPIETPPGDQDLAVEQPGDEVAGDHEEDVDADEASGQERDPGVGSDDHQDCDGAQPLDVSAELFGHRPRCPMSSRCVESIQPCRPRRHVDHPLAHSVGASRSRVTTYRIAVMGGTGPQGKGLGYRFARHGHAVVIGSRAAEKAAATAEEIRARLTGVDGCRRGHRRGQRRRLRGRRRGAARGAVGRPRRARRRRCRWPARPSSPASTRSPSTSAARTAWSSTPARGRPPSGPGLAPEATVVGAFHNVSAVRLWGDEDYLDEDVLCVGDSDEGKAVAMELARGRHRPRGHQRRQAAAGPPARAVHRRADLDQPEVQGALRHPDHRPLTPASFDPESTATLAPLRGLRCRRGHRGRSRARSLRSQRSLRSPAPIAWGFSACRSRSPTARRTSRRPRPARRATRAR